MARKQRWMPDYVATDEEQLAYIHCVKNNIQVSPQGASGTLSHWKVAVCVDGTKWHVSPKTYGVKEIWKKYYEVCTYYYDKRKTT